MIQFGNEKIKEIYYGSDKIKEVYHGADLVWSGKPSKPSYAILTDDTRVDFELGNTPIDNFYTSSSTVVINSSSISRNSIKELVFGDSYKNVTSIGNYFLRGCSSLTSLDLNAFSNVTSIGALFLNDCSALTSLDLNAFSNVTSIGMYFLYGCSKLTQFKVGAVNVPSTPSTGFLQNTTALTTILVPMQSVQAYKTKSPWSNHASKITGY